MRWLQRVVELLESYVVLPAVNVPDFSPPSDPRDISDDEIEKAAVALRRHWSLGDGVIVDLIKLLEGNGCIVVAKLIECSTMDGFSQWTRSGRPYIAIDCRSVGAAHRRMDVAHELGHLILHRAVDRRFVESNPHTHKLIEAQAFRFAGAFLLPEPTFRRTVPNVTLDSLLLLKRQWRLSVAAMLHRAQDLAMLNAESAKKLWINRNRRGWRVDEPFDEQIEIEEPRLLQNAFFVLRDSSGDQISAISDELGLYAKDLARYAGLDESDLHSASVPDFPITLRSPDLQVAR